MPFQPTTSPIDTGNGNRSPGRPFETVGGVSREGISSVNITADETNNALVILATAREYAVIQDALRQLDTSPVQVLLEAAIAEVSLTKDTQFGFQYFYQPRQAANNSSQIIWAPNTSTTVAGASTSATAALSTAFPGFAYMFTNGDSISAILNALGTQTRVETLSSPEVMVLNNQTASLEVGDQVPIVTATAVSTITTDAPTVNSVEYLDTGVILKVTPRVNRGGQVMMDVSQEVSSVTSTTSSTINSPTIQQRKINSSVSVEDGETVALGGLFTNQVTKTKNGIPYLEDIPYLGNIFANHDDNRNKDELIVLITPHVVDDIRKAHAITEELRHRLPEVENVLEQKP
jgi:general secretion pathway protein D